MRPRRYLTCSPGKPLLDGNLIMIKRRFTISLSVILLYSLANSHADSAPLQSLSLVSIARRLHKMSTPDKGSSSRLTQLIASAPRPDELKRLSNEDPVPYQKLAIGAAQRGHVQLLAYCLDAGGAVVDNDVEIAAWKGASPELYAVMMDHGWPARPNALSMTQVLATNYVKGPSMIEFLVGRGAVVTRDLVISIASHSRGDVASLEVIL